MAQVQRNDPCPCGSGKKYKKCCMNADKPTWMSGSRLIYVALAAIFVLSLSLRYYGYLQPHKLTFDEGLYAELIAPQLAENPLNYSTQEAYRYQISIGQKVPAYLDTPLFKHPPLYNYFVALIYKIFGAGHLSAVSVSIVFGSLMMIVVFLLARELYDERVGLLAAALLCVDPVHWICSEKIWMETTMSFFMLLAVYLFVVGERRKAYLIGCGISIGLAMLTKYPGILILMILGPHVILVERRLVKLRDIVMVGITAFIVFCPWIVWNMKVGGGLGTMLSAHGLGKDVVLRSGQLQRYGPVCVLVIAAGVAIMFLRKKIPFQYDALVKRAVMAGLAACLLWWPVTRTMLVESFAWKSDFSVGWSNPHYAAGWPFYLVRLCTLAPFSLLGFLAAILIFGKDRGDRLMIMSVLVITAAFTVLGNYQSRYILPAVPFLMISAARLTILVHDKLKTGDRSFGTTALKSLLFLTAAYFMIKTLRTDMHLAIGPDFGYF